MHNKIVQEKRSIYSRNAKLTFAFIVLALSAIALFAPLVGAQKQDKRPDLSRLLKPDELRQRHQQLKKKRDEMRTRLDDLRAGLIQQKKAMRAELAASAQFASSAPSTLESTRGPAAKKPAPAAGNAGSTIVVHSLADDGPGSLRQALQKASDGAKINITVKGTIRLTSGELVVDKSVTIRGPGKAHGSVSGNGVSRVFHITPGVTVSLEGLTIKDGRVTTEPGFFPASAGGGIYNDHAMLTLTGCALSNNSARFGGAIFSNSKDGGAAIFTVNNTTVSSNSAIYGGGIFSGGGSFNTGPSGDATLAINNSAISGNSAGDGNYFAVGGGILNDGFAGSATLTVTNSAISGNFLNPIGSGGGIYNNGDSGVATVTLTNSTVNDHSSASGLTCFGCGIYNDGTSTVNTGYAAMTLTNSTFNRNPGTGALTRSDSDFAIYNDGESAFVELIDTILTENSGIGIENNGALVSITRSEISRSFFCGIVNSSNSTLSIRDSEIRENEPGGVRNEGTATITNTVVNHNFSEDVRVSETDGPIGNRRGTMTVINSTVSNNVVPDGLIGAVSNIDGTLTVIDSTVSNNRGDPHIDGVTGLSNIGFEDTAILTVINSTVSGNSQDTPFSHGIINIGVSDGAVLRLSNSTVSNHPGVGVANVFAMVEIANTILNANSLNIFSFGTVISSAYNLSSDAAGGDGGTGPGGLLNGPGDMRNTNPHLGPLQNNGGPTMTHALLPYSPAIDNGNPNFNPNAFDPPLLYDQRGRPFSRVVNGCIDIGAFEFRSP